ncbi:MAG TPA: hypothetical protein VH396_22220 [Chitinophagaceae bacterium]|jgi:hypothetical protein
METQAHSFESLFGRAGEYFETRVELMRLKSVDKSSDIISSAISKLAIIVTILISIIILSIGLALWIGEQTGKSYYGFFIVGGFYIFIALIGYIARNRLLKVPIANLFINKVLNEENNKK